jgi:hypothetical protein
MQISFGQPVRFGTAFNSLEQQEKRLLTKLKTYGVTPENGLQGWDIRPDSILLLVKDAQVKAFANVALSSKPGEQPRFENKPVELITIGEWQLYEKA